MGKKKKHKRGLKSISQKMLEAIAIDAIKNNWEFIEFQKDSGMISFKRNNERLNYWITTGTLSTSVIHPIEGRIQTFRRNIPINCIFKKMKSKKSRGYYTK
jgi:hypothetical protein